MIVNIIVSEHTMSGFKRQLQNIYYYYEFNQSHDEMQ